jgi:hypothetical protein
MIGTIALVLGGFALLVHRSYRSAARSERPFQPEGKLRWTDDSAP